MLKTSLLFRKNTNFIGELLENSYDQECKIFRVLFLYELEYIGRFSNLYWCTFKQSRKLCLDLWSRRSLKPIISPVITFIPIRLWQLDVLFGDGRMNCKMLFFQNSSLSRLFHSITVGGKNEFLKKVFATLNWRILSILFLVLYAVLVVGILSNRYLEDSLLVILKK